MSLCREPPPKKHTRIKYQPIGPMLAVMPWNFPFSQVGPSLHEPDFMVGNVALLKHASEGIGPQR